MVCAVCGDSRFGDTVVPDYYKCLGCGHEVKKGELSDTLMVNDVLDIAEVRRASALEKFKIRCVNQCAQDHRFLIDIGCSSGKFLWHVRTFFDQILGIEITPACTRFCIDTLHLPIESSINSVSLSPSVVTLWHSLEHIPGAELDTLFLKLAALSKPTTRIIISVPNADSWLYRLLGKHFTYYDPASHVHQFTPHSLNLLCARYGFTADTRFFSASYSLFGYVQSFLNILNPSRNFLYFYLKRGKKYYQSTPPRVLGVAYNIVLALLCGVPALIGTCLDWCFKSKGVVQTVCFRPNQ